MRSVNPMAVAWFVSILSAAVSQAAPLYWDPDLNSGDGADGGAGAWTAAGGQWWDGGAYVDGGTADTYIFAGTGGAVSTPGTVNWKTVNTLRFSANGYSLTGANYMTAGTVTVDAGISTTLTHRVFNSSNVVVNGGGTLTYNGATYLGGGGNGVTLSGAGTTLLVQGGGVSCSNTAGGTSIGAGTTLRAMMSNALATGTGNYIRLTVNGTYDLNGYSQGSLITASTYGIKALLLNSGGSILGGGGSLVVQSQNTSSSLGYLTMTGGSIDTENGNLAFLSNSEDPSFDIAISGGTISTGSGKLILGGAGTAENPNGVNLALSGGASISGNIDLTNSFSASAKTRTFNVADGAEVVDFTIAAAIADGAHAGSGIRKAGAGTLLLGGTNSYTGLTTVASGTLKLSGSLATSRITIDAGAAMTGGSGTIVFTPGDVIDVNGSLDLNGMFFDLSALGAPTSPLTLLDYSGGGGISNLAGLSYTAGWMVRDTGTGLAGVVPEPGAFGLLAAAGLLACRRHRPPR